MGVEPYLLASSLLGVLAQRLVRTLCPACRVTAPPSDGEARIVGELGLAPHTRVAASSGCAQCSQTGYRGRTGVYELLQVDDTMRRLIHDGAGELALRDAAIRTGMRTLRADGARWIANGTTSLAELMRVTRDS
jgi:general secretion pathway protein E